MENLGINYSFKKHTYSIQRVIPDQSNREDWNAVKRMRCRAHFLIQENHERDIWREDFGFKSKSTPPQGELMEACEKEFLDVIPNIESRAVKDTFQKKWKEDILKIKQLRNVFVFADKRNIYKMPEQQHKKILHDSVTKTYKKRYLN